ncbi:MAG: RsmB/NOP family class I SAM-dependent RNA methyltransferase [Lachnospiraceae bacterium]|nr:RsmB/NOP family class I SAM-dependent RNA methyltransferase [Lachnospiraceae bacterium]
MELPKNFLEMMKYILGEDLDEYLRSFDAPQHFGMRINTSKLSVDEFIRLTDDLYETRPVQWCDCGLYYEGLQAVTKSPYYHAGLYYIQEPSAMLPAAALPIEEGDRVLDLCAAPGGKSTQLAAKLNGTGFLLANDISNTRAKALLKNLELFGLANIAVSSDNHERLSECFPEYFDKILVDAPCSGEGMFRREPAMVKSWLDKGPEYYAPLQAEILEHAYKMLKPGGMLLYSTCTFSPLENEANVYRLLKAHDDARLVPISITEGMRHGLSDDILTACGAISRESVMNDVCTGCARIFPNDGFGEGHFAALIQKNDSTEQYKTQKKYISKNPDDNIEKEYISKNPTDTAEKEYISNNEKGNQDCLSKNEKTISVYPNASGFLAFVSDDFLGKGEITEINDRLYMLPEDFKINTNIRYLRTGLLLGELVKGKGADVAGNKGKKNKASYNRDSSDSKNVRFEPSQALAMALDMYSFSRIINFRADDISVIKYLKGETVMCPDDCTLENGWCLITVDDFPLGFAIKNGDVLKNKYFTGWRMQ